MGIDKLLHQEKVLYASNYKAFESSGVPWYSILLEDLQALKSQDADRSIKIDLDLLPKDPFFKEFERFVAFYKDTYNLKLSSRSGKRAIFLSNYNDVETLQADLNELGIGRFKCGKNIGLDGESKMVVMPSGYKEVEFVVDFATDEKERPELVDFLLNNGQGVVFSSRYSVDFFDINKLFDKENVPKAIRDKYIYSLGEKRTYPVDHRTFVRGYAELRRIAKGVDASWTDSKKLAYIEYELAKKLSYSQEIRSNFLRTVMDSKADVRVAANANIYQAMSSGKSVCHISTYAAKALLNYFDIQVELNARYDAPKKGGDNAHVHHYWLTAMINDKDKKGQDIKRAVELDLIEVLSLKLNLPLRMDSFNQSGLGGNEIVGANNPVFQRFRGYFKEFGFKEDRSFLKILNQPNFEKRMKAILGYMTQQGNAVSLKELCIFFGMFSKSGMFRLMKSENSIKMDEDGGYPFTQYDILNYYQKMSNGEYEHRALLAENRGMMVISSGGVTFYSHPCNNDRIMMLRSLPNNDTGVKFEVVTDSFGKMLFNEEEIIKLMYGRRIVSNVAHFDYDNNNPERFKNIIDKKLKMQEDISEGAVYKAEVKPLSPFEQK